jgi:hypothetical protein
MEPFDKRVLCFCAAACAFCIVYAFDPPALLYFPLERRWGFPEPGKDQIGMRWYGRGLWGFGSALVTAAIAAAALPWVHVKPTESKNRAPHWIMSLLAVGGLFTLMALIAYVEFAKSKG